MTRTPRILVMGASGRLGGMLHRNWSDTTGYPIWQFRKPPTVLPSVGDVMVLDPLQEKPSCAPVDQVLCLAGTVPGKGDMMRNIDLGLAAIRLGIALEARHVMLASSASVYGPSDAAQCETALPYPNSAYGQAKLEMEGQALAFAERHGIAATMLRIGNVAGADALLAQSGNLRTLDQFGSGKGPERSYIGPAALSTLLQLLMHHICSGGPMPARLNLALRGGVAMADLCTAAGIGVAWRTAPASALERVVLDVTRLSDLVDVPAADAHAIVEDWRADQTKQRKLP